MDRPRFRIPFWVLLLVGYAFLGLVSLPSVVSGFTPDQQNVAIGGFLQLAGGVLLFVNARYILARNSPLPYLAMVLAGATFAAILGIVADLNGGAAGLPARAVFSPVPNVEWGGRTLGPFVNANYFGLFLAVSLVLAVGLLRALGGRYRVVLAFSIVVMAYGLVLTLSRSAILALAVGVLVLAFTRSRTLGVALSITAVGAAVVVYPIFLDARLSETWGQASSAAYLAEAASESYRQSALEAGVRLFLERPIFGLGFGGFQFASPRFLEGLPVTASHNQFTSILAEQGLVGFTMVAALIGGAAIAVGTVAAAPWRGLGLALVVTYVASWMFQEPNTVLQASGTTYLALAAVLSMPRRAAVSVDERASPASRPLRPGEWQLKGVR
jgi:O-antigen ligase